MLPVSVTDTVTHQVPPSASRLSPGIVNAVNIRAHESAWASNRLDRHGRHGLRGFVSFFRDNQASSLPHPVKTTKTMDNNVQINRPCTNSDSDPVRTDPVRTGTELLFNAPD